MTRIIVAALVLAALAGPAHAAGFEDIAALEARVVAALDADVGAPGGPAAPLDRRMKLARCPQPATIDPPALGALPLRCPALGWRIRVPLSGVQAIAGSARAAVAPAPVIKRGDPVELVARAGQISVSTQAIAQEDGVIGGRIRVKTDPKSGIIIGEVADAGVVRVGGI